MLTKGRENISPKAGYISITINNEIYNKILAAMKEANRKAGYKRFRSAAHFVEYVVMDHELIKAIMQSKDEE